MEDKAQKAHGTPAGETAIQTREERQAWVNGLHRLILPGSVLKNMFERSYGSSDLIQKSAAEHVQQTLERMGVRDPVEEMLVIQMLYQHQRFTELTAKAPAQTNLDWAKMCHETADRAANTYRRQMLALAEYRQPPRQRPINIQQANMADQQVVQNVVRRQAGARKKATNEKGCGRTEQRGGGQTALPAIGRRLGVPSSVRGAGEAVAGDSRPDNGRG